MQKILVFGGTFNPIHLGHIHLYRHFERLLAVDKVLIIPAKTPPHKRAEELADGAHRLEMCRLAVQDDPLAEVSDMELRRSAVSYTIDTLKELAAAWQGAALYLVVGSDMFFTLEKWREPEKIVRLATVCALARRPNEYTALQKKAEELKRRYGGRFLLDNAEVLTISSTALRGLVKRGGDLAPSLPEAVARYIKTNGLYLNNEI